MRRLIFAAAASLAALALPAHAIEGGGSRIQRVVSPGGIEAWLVSEPAIPMVAVEVGFEGGGRLDGPDRMGAAYLASGLIEEGAGDMDSQAFARRLEDLSARMSFESGRDGFQVSVRSLTENLPETMALLETALTEPRFEPRQVERVREQVLSGLRSSAVDPQSQAGRAWFEAMFGDSAYGRPFKGTIESVEALTREDLLAVWDEMVARDRMTIGVVGDIDAETLGPLLDETFGGLPERGALEAEPLPVRAEGGVEVIEADVPQSVVVFGHEGILREDPDFIPAYVMNYVLGGGGFESRLYREVREKEGLAYSVYSYLNPLDRAGLYMGGTGTQNERVADAVAIIRREWARMAEEGVTDEELERAKKYLTGAFALRFDSNAKIARYLVGLQQAGLGIGYIDERNGLVDAVTKEDIQRVAQRLLKPESLFVVVAGKPEGLESTAAPSQ